MGNPLVVGAASDVRELGGGAGVWGFRLASGLGTVIIGYCSTGPGMQMFG